MAILILSDNGAITRKTTLALAVAAADVVGKTIIVTTDQTIDTVTVPATMSLEIKNGAVITVNSGKILTINGSFNAELRQCFAGAGTVVFGSNSTAQYQAVWSGGTDAPSCGRKNRLINGAFSIWQRNTSQTSAGYGSDDRWYNFHFGSTKTVSRNLFSSGGIEPTPHPLGLSGPCYFSRTVVVTSVGAANAVYKVQRVEGVRTLNGKTATLSF